MPSVAWFSREPSIPICAQGKERPRSSQSRAAEARDTWAMPQGQAVPQNPNFQPYLLSGDSDTGVDGQKQLGGPPCALASRYCFLGRGRCRAPSRRLKASGGLGEPPQRPLTGGSGPGPGKTSQFGEFAGLITSELCPWQGESRRQGGDESGLPGRGSGAGDAGRPLASGAIRPAPSPVPRGRSCSFIKLQVNKLIQ